MKKRIRLTLLEPYTWPSFNPEKPNSSKISFVQTIDLLPKVGSIVQFEDLHPYSDVGDLNTEMYCQYEGRKFKRIMKINPDGIFYDAEFQEVK